jgi:arylsulfatase A-like enzyme
MGDRGFAGKWSHYEQSLRVPMIIHDPRLSAEKHDRVLPQMVMNLDLASTILDIVGVAVPEKYQGKSLVPFVNGKTPASWRTDLFNEHHFNHNRIPKWRGVRSERYTYARYYEQKPPYEILHDLESDPDQLKNLASSPKHESILKQMRDRTDEYIEMYTRPEIEALRNGSRKK